MKERDKDADNLKNIIGDLKNYFFPPLSKLEERNKKNQQVFV